MGVGRGDDAPRCASRWGDVICCDARYKPARGGEVRPMELFRGVEPLAPLTSLTERSSGGFAEKDARLLCLGSAGLLRPDGVVAMATLVAAEIEPARAGEASARNISEAEGVTAASSAVSSSPLIVGRVEPPLLGDAACTAGDGGGSSARRDTGDGATPVCSCCLWSQLLSRARCSARCCSRLDNGGPVPPSVDARGRKPADSVLPCCCAPFSMTLPLRADGPDPRTERTLAAGEPGAGMVLYLSWRAAGFSDATPSMLTAAAPLFVGCARPFVTAPLTDPRRDPVGDGLELAGTDDAAELSKGELCDEAGTL